MKFRSDARALAITLLKRGMTATEAAKVAGMCPDTLYPCLRQDKTVSIRTAAKLRATFGDAVVKITEPV